MSLEDLSMDQLRELAGRAEKYAPAHNLVEQLGKDPDMRLALQRWAKKKNPTLSIPEVDAEDRIQAALKEEREAREKREAKLTEDEARRNIEAQKRAVIEKYHLTADDVTAIEKRMLKSDDNPDPLPPRYDWAAQLYMNSRTPSTPTPSAFLPPTYSMPEGKVWGKGIGNPAELNRIANDQAALALQEIRGGKVAQ
ncbi:MAG: hypothetical protein HRJ53_21685 [Acidobacteria bacterium Pan2503]|uniref:Uncharacterized protein n=1 Tax=Candidatus Acidiferrum panamense TaxID=2741543 RepID=A0A7V8NU70_9BACT|nr:hypothetical protein [Candidatus Acidoferrum panamensis]